MTDQTRLGSVETRVDNNIATIEFEHPSHNALPGRLLKQLAGAIVGAGEHEDVKVIVLRSGGDRTFCAGASFDELMAIEDRDSGKEFFMGFARLINACRRCSRLIIGRVQGKAVGGGVGLASAVDCCFGTEYSSVKLSELAIGIGPFVVGPAVRRKIGTAAFSQLALRPDHWHTPEWAQDKGLFQEIFPTNERMDEAVQKLADQWATYSKSAMKAMKKMLWEGTEHWGDLLEERAEISGDLVLSDYTEEFIRNFKQKNQ